MDNLRSAFGSGEPDEAIGASESREWEPREDVVEGEEDGSDLPPHAIGQDERRMQVRAYNHWASQLGDRMFPLIEDLDPAALPDFAPYSVLLDFSVGIDNPAVQYLGERLAEECGDGAPIRHLSDVPARSLLSRITDHYMQILANQAPIGFEAEFVNHRGVSILYRGILLPYSSDDQTIDFIYGVINWKEMADAATADELLLEIDQALDLDEPGEARADAPAVRPAEPVTDWADSPAHETIEPEMIEPDTIERLRGFVEAAARVAPFGRLGGSASEDADLPVPDFGQYNLDDGDGDEEYDEELGDEVEGSYNFASLADYIEAPAKKAIDPAEFALENEAVDLSFEQHESDFAFEHGESEQAEDFIELAPLPADAGLFDCLAAARELAQAASSTEDRSRSALYAAVGRAYDFSLAAQDAPEDYARLIAESGLSVQDRAPMTPVVKLVFGPDYDKTRLTEYAAVLTHAHRIGLERGSLARFLVEAEGGLKGVVKAERRLRREEQGRPEEEEPGIRAALARKLRELEALALEALGAEGPEFALVMVRRDGEGGISVIGELAEDVPLLERAAKKLVG